ncbi:hypothetical protein BB561_002772 [Smittium simulii]|uniref:VPS9 domain-containing protein n=1 Tax=Smittium simulii TaxID=133385 RepID=A0A2T9YPG8_9FUNG|nr:hypothetical protein BB561_002772 [Smittium simulii]
MDSSVPNTNDTSATLDSNLAEIASTSLPPDSAEISSLSKDLPDIVDNVHNSATKTAQNNLVTSSVFTASPEIKDSQNFKDISTLSEDVLDNPDTVNSTKLSLGKTEPYSSNKDITSINTIDTTTNTTSNTKDDTIHNITEKAPNVDSNDTILDTTNNTTSNTKNDTIPDIASDINVITEKTSLLTLDTSNEHSPPYSQTSNETSSLRKQSNSKVHNAIQDLLNQFDPLKEANAKKSIDSLNVKSEFWVDKDGFSYNRFLEQLRHPVAKPIAKQIKIFLVEFEKKKLPLNLQIKYIQDFYNSTDDSAKDRVLKEKINLFRWLKQSHLDIPESTKNSSFIQFAKTELLKINEFKSPRDKLICILNCCTVIFGLLKHLEGEVGADSFLPLLIYVIVIANPTRLVSNINYISRFRAPEKLLSEAGYYLTNVMGAMSFIETMDATCLSITQEEFDKSIELSIWEIESEKRAKARAKSRSPRETRSNEQSPGRGYWSSIIDKEAADKASWLLERGSTLAKSTFEKTNQFVENLFSDFSDTTSKTRDFQPTLPPRPSNQSSTDNMTPSPNLNQIDMLDQSLVAENSDEWYQTLTLMCDMFPNFDKEVCEMILQVNNGYVPQTIEQLLEMSLTESQSFNDLLDNENSKSVQSIKNNDELDEVYGTNQSSLNLLAGTSKELIPSGKENIIQDKTSNLIAESSKFGNATMHSKNDHTSDNNEEWKGRWADDSSEDDFSDNDQFDNDEYMPDNILANPEIELNNTLSQVSTNGLHSQPVEKTSTSSKTETENSTS